MWKRNLTVTLSNDEGVFRRYKEHRIDFEVRSSLGWVADTANISIFNLSINEIKELQSRKHGQIRVELSGGYGEKPVITRVGDYNVKSPINSIFIGYITNSLGYSKPPENVLNLFCHSIANFKVTSFKKMNKLVDLTLEDAIKSMCNDYSITTISYFGVDKTLLSKKVPKRVFHNTFIEEFTQFLREYNLQYYLTTSEVQIFPETYGNKHSLERMMKDRKPIQLNPNQVIGNPITGVATISLTTFLNSSIQPGMILDINPLLGKELLVNGVVSTDGNWSKRLNYDDSVMRYALTDKYHIQEVVHTGSTHSTTFFTKISGVMGANTLMGINESAWRERIDEL